MFDTTIMLWVGAVLARGEAWGPAAVSGVLIAQGAPVLLVGPFAGVFTDRWDKRRTMLAMNALSGAAVAALLCLMLVGDDLSAAVQLTACYAVVAAVSVCAQFFTPARVTLIGDVVAPEDRGRASSLGQASFSTAMIVGPPLAAPLLFTIGVEWSLVVNALSFGVSFAMIALVRTRTPATKEDRPSWRSQFSAGLRFFTGSRPLMVSAMALALAMGAGEAVSSLAVFFITDNLHTTADMLGTLVMTQGIGAVAGALLSAAVIPRLGTARALCLSLLLNGIALTALSRTESFAWAMVEVGLIGAALSAQNSALSPLVLTLTPREMVGRVMSVFVPLLQVASIASAALAGTLVSTALRDLDVVVLGLRLGPVDTVFLAAGALVALASVLAAVGLRGWSEKNRDSSGP
ncbi:MFS transporter [Actinokineospora sp. NPDC004072]